MAVFVIYSTSESGQPKTVIRYGECPAEDIADQAGSGEAAAAVSAGQLANFVSYAALLENPPETGGSFTGWMTFDSSTGEINLFIASATSSAADLLQQRDILLRDSDWTQLLDAPLTSAKQAQWATYRQALRDIPSQPGYPGSVTWPTKPT